MKKAQESNINALIMAAVTLFLLLMILKNIWINLKDEPEKFGCRISVLKNAENREFLDIQDVLVNCKTKYVLFKKTGYIESLEDKEPDEETLIPYSDDESECEDDDCIFSSINRVISDEMLTCWDMFLKGDKRLFSTRESDRQCFICSVIFFDNEMKKEYQDLGLLGMYEETYSLDEFMKNNKPNRIEYSQNELSYYALTLDLMDHVDPYYYDYETGHDYAIVFSALNENYIKNLEEEAYNMLLEKLGKDPMVDHGDFVNRLHFIENDQVSEECDMLI